MSQWTLTGPLMIEGVGIRFRRIRRDFIQVLGMQKSQIRIPTTSNRPRATMLIHDPTTAQQHRIVTRALGELDKVNRVRPA
jgi:hypothetical protein